MTRHIESGLLQGRKILLGVCGSIAAYKSLLMVRLLIKAGAEVQVLMTETASDFVGPLSFSTLSKNPVYSSVSNKEGWNNHVELGLWADAMLIAPVTATSLSKLRMGLADNIIVAVYLSARCPVFLAPAMDLDMWKHGSTQDNIKTLSERGDQMIEPDIGELTSGLVGQGRMAEPEAIIDFLCLYFKKNHTLAGKNVLINAGSTQEAIDPIRFIGNRSSGKMGLALAKEAKKRGAHVQVVVGNVTVSFDNLGLEISRAMTAEEMYNETTNHFPNADITILAAAIADYRPATVSNVKIKKNNPVMEISLVKTKDIAQHLGTIKNENQVLVGFALETNNELAYATEKRKKKNFDFIVLNSLRDKGAGLEHNTNKVQFIMPDNKRIDFELKPKEEVAVDIFDAIENLSNHE